MKYLCCLIVCFQLFGLQAQERKSLKRVVINNGSAIANVHVKNISTNKYAITNEIGLFALNARQGDTLLLSHVVMKDLIIFLEKRDFEAEILKLEMTARDNELDEVYISEEQEINAVTLGIIPKKIPIPTTNERRLQTAGDWKPKHLIGLLFGGIALDPILNAINGRTKMLKRNIKIEKKIKLINTLEASYYDYMRDTVEIPEDEIQLFINFLIDNEDLQAIINSKNESHVHFFLHENWISFQEDRK